MTCFHELLHLSYHKSTLHEGLTDFILDYKNLYVESHELVDIIIDPSKNDFHVILRKRDGIRVAVVRSPGGQIIQTIYYGYCPDAIPTI